MTDAPAILYHYTTLEGLLGILESRVLWATSIRHLNDSSEFRYTVDLVRDVILDIPRGASGAYGRSLDPFREALSGMEEGTVYVSSFSAAPDLLSQWRAYGQPGIGVALGVRTTDLAQVAALSAYTLERCEYDRDRQVAILQAALEAASSPPQPLPFGRNVLECAPAFKHPSFSEEAEWRLVSGRPAAGPLSFRRVGSLAVPYRRIPFTLRGAVPLAEIVLAPSAHPAENQFALELLLAHHELAGVHLRQSAIPYRTR